MPGKYTNGDPNCYYDFKTFQSSEPFREWQNEMEKHIEDDMIKSFEIIDIMPSYNVSLPKRNQAGILVTYKVEYFDKEN